MKHKVTLIRKSYVKPLWALQQLCGVFLSIKTEKYISMNPKSILNEEINGLTQTTRKILGSEIYNFLALS